MRLIDCDIVITTQLYDEEHEEFTEESMTIADCLDRFTDEGCPEPFKTIEPRVLSEDEVKKQKGYVWKELRGAEAMSVVLINGKTRDYDFLSGWYSYNILWRCWSAQPTDEQRKRVQWRSADGN